MEKIKIFSLIVDKFLKSVYIIKLVWVLLI